MSAPSGIARIAHGDNSLTHFNNNAAVGPEQERKWEIRPTHTDDSGAIVIILKDDSGEEKCLTLDNNPDSPDANILLKPLESPPSPEQLWTMADAIAVPRLPPVVIGRIQSATNPNLSATVAGHVPMPVMFMNVAAVPYNGDMERFRWRMDYIM